MGYLKFMYKKIAVVFYLTFLLVMSGCSEKITPNFLRDREFDYNRKSVVQPNKIEIPNNSGMENPAYSPYYTLPKGQDIYPPSTNPNKVLPPPGIDS